MHYKQKTRKKIVDISHKCIRNSPRFEIALTKKWSIFLRKHSILTIFIYILSYFCGLSGDFFCRGLVIIVRHKLTEAVAVNRVGYYSGNDIRDKLCPHDAVETEQSIHHEEQRNIYHTLTEGGEDKRLLSHTHSLEAEGDLQVKEHKGHRQTEYAEEVGRHCDRLLVAVKDGADVGCQQLENKDASRGKDHCGISCHAGEGAHTLVIARGEVISYERHHTLAETKADVHRQHIDLFRNADRRNGYVAVEIGVA